MLQISDFVESWQILKIKLVNIYTEYQEYLYVSISWIFIRQFSRLENSDFKELNFWNFLIYYFQHMLIKL